MAGKSSFRNWLVKQVVMSMLKDWLSLKPLKGKRTKLIAIVQILYAIAGMLLGNLTPEVGVPLIATALGLLTAASHNE